MRSLRCTLFSLMVVSPLAAWAAEAQPSLSKIIERASAEQKPIVLDVYAVWCRPCMALEKNVFPLPAVKAELASWVFQRVDGETVEGEAIASAFNITSYPTLLVLSPEGFEVGRVSQFEPQVFISVLHGLHDQAMQKLPPPSTFATTKDARLLATLAKRAQGTERLTLWKRALEADPQGLAGIGGQAALELTVADLSTQSLAREAAALRSLVEKYPSSSQALAALDGLASLPKEARPTHEQLVPLIDALKKSRTALQPSCELNGGVYALFAMGELELALTLAQHMVIACGEANYLDTLAEAHHQLGHHVDAVKVEKQALTLEPKNPSLLEDLARYEAGKPDEPPGGRFSNPLHPEANKAPPEETKRRIVGRSIGAMCEHLPHTRGRVWLRVRPEGKAKVKVLALDPELNPKLKQCLETSAAANPKVAALPEEVEFEVYLRDL